MNLEGRESQDQEVHLERLVLLDQMEDLEKQGHVEAMANLENKDQEASKVNEVEQDLQEPLEHVENQELLVFLEQMEGLVSKAHKDLLVQVAYLVREAALEHRENVVHLVRVDHQDNQDQQGNVGQLVHKEREEALDKLVDKDLLVFQGREVNFCGSHFSPAIMNDCVGSYKCKVRNNMV